MYMNALSSDDEGPMYRTRQRHGKYSDLMASRVSKTAAAECKYKYRLNWQAGFYVLTKLLVNLPVSLLSTISSMTIKFHCANIFVFSDCEDSNFSRNE